MQTVRYNIIMDSKINKLDLIIKARNLRKEKTKAEKILWQALRNNNLGIKFRRQHPVDMFILDFYANRK